ncbi:MAG: sterol desaturase family protein [Flavobacteriales bacterium]|nr:MAG: sterol desaturase family protein [Flavobacteriales bacterium]
METIINYFESIPSSHRSLILVGGLTFFWIIESRIPLFVFRYNKWRHAGVNAVFTLTTIVVNFSLAFLLVKSADFVFTNEIGVLHLIEMPIWLFFILGLLLMDLIGAWLAHYVQHHTPFLWQFHLVHHTDKNIDTTTGNRHHPGESVVRFCFTLAAVWIIGAPIWIVMIYQSLSVVLTQFNHANIEMNSTIDSILGLVFVTPNIHRIHHHYKLPLTDSNYGNIFSFWDRIFGTFTAVDNKSLIYGLDTHFTDDDSQNIGVMLKAPFVRKKKN